MGGIVKTKKRIELLGVVTALVSWLLYRRWQQSFHAVGTEDVGVSDRTGTPRPGKRVWVQSVFDAPPDVVWAEVTKPALLAYVTSPLLTFKRQGGAPLPDLWREGDSINFNLFGLGVIPLGPHTVNMERIDTAAREIQSRESGQMAEVWWHYVAVEEYPGARTLYTDEIDIYAGPLTGVVACFARFFYRYRQTRWRRVLSGGEPTLIRRVRCHGINHSKLS
jgi:ligand-binding SRPBCC domain-containing protein